MLFSRKSGPQIDSTPARLIPAEQPRQLPQAAGIENPGAARPQSFIDASLTIVGDLHTDGDVELDGRICGTVRCAQLIVGRDATITGGITAGQTIVRGRVTGTIRSPVVILQGTARVDSEVTYRVLVIDDGATFEGTVRRVDNPLQEDAATPLAALNRMTPTPDAASSAAGETGAHGTAAAGAAPPGANGHDPAPTS